MNAIQSISEPLRSAGLNGFRICFETAQWLSSDGNVKIYYHVHIQHDDYPDYNSGVGANSVDELKVKLKATIVPELEALGANEVP